MAMRRNEDRLSFSTSLRWAMARSINQNPAPMRTVYAATMTRLLLLCVILASVPASADELLQSLTGRSNKPLIDPAGFFAVVIPPGFDCSASPRKVRCQSNRGIQAVLSIDVVDVPPSATVELVLLNQIDAFQKKPHYKLLGKRPFTIDGTKALMASFTYDHFG